MAPPVVPTVKLSNGYEVPVIGLGTWKSKPGEVTQAVKDAIDAGYRHIDCAITYRNEPEVGAALSAKMAEGVIRREDIFVTSKLWNTCHRPDLVIPQLKQTLTNLGLAYVDLYLIHWPFAFQEGGENMPKDADGNVIFSDVDYVDTWKSMEEAHRQKLAKSIGVSNFNSLQVSRVLEVATIKPVMNQVECHPYLNQKRLIEFCRARGIQVTGYSPLGSRDSVFAKPGGRELLDDPVLGQLAAKHGRSPAQVALRYQIQRGMIVVPKSVTKKRIIENISIFDFELSPEDMALVDSLDCNGRICRVEHSLKHKHYPFSAEF
ncbi:aldo-keto reductase family 1 member B1-like [Bacillus rossius redtenbacheri]|uniref:aldo-keto reductase family 1 member B1-like n=1 Tax=Bacillus rossius redtenbacheri TaxID=93214 RepID=UPI002FDD3751